MVYSSMIGDCVKLLKFLWIQRKNIEHDVWFMFVEVKVVACAVASMDKAVFD